MSLQSQTEKNQCAVKRKRLELGFDLWSSEGNWGCRSTIWDLLFLTLSALFVFWPPLQGGGAMADAEKLAQSCLESSYQEKDLNLFFSKSGLKLLDFLFLFFNIIIFSIMSIVQSDSAWLWSLCNPFVWRETISSALWMSLSNSCFQIKGRKASDPEQPWDDCTRWNLQNLKVFKKSFLNMARRKKKDHVQRVRKGDTSWNVPC